MNKYVTDTHALFWYLTANPRLSAGAKSAFDEGARGEAVIYIPSIVLAELFFLNEKLGQPVDFAVEYAGLKRSAQFEFEPFAPDHVLDLASDSSVAEMHDRIIVGVARRRDASCITRDASIIASKLVAVVW